MLQYLIVCPLVFLAGFVDSIAGGGGLISLPAYIIAGVPAHFAIGTNKLSSTLGTSISTWRYLKQGRLLSWIQLFHDGKRYGAKAYDDGGAPDRGILCASQ